MRSSRTLLVAAALAAACGPGSEKEPNDHFTQATALRPGAVVRGQLGSASDIDVFRIDATRPQVVDVRVGGIRGADFVLSFQDKDRVELKRIDETAAGGDERALDLGLDEGVYYLALSNKAPGYQPEGQAYELTTSVRPDGSAEREPNDRAAQATELGFGGTLRGHYHPSRNVLTEADAADAGVEYDWFRVRIGTAGVYLLNLDLSEVPRVDPVLEVFDVNGYKVKEADAGGPGQAESLRSFGVRGPVEYAVRLRAKGRVSVVDVPYELVTELLPYQGGAELEPNEQRAEATPFETPQINGYVSQPGDADWFVVTVPSETKHVLRAELSPVAGMDLVLSVMDDVGNPVLVVDNMGKDQPEVLTGLVAGGAVHLVVTEKSAKKTDARAGYTLTKTVDPVSTGLEYELNDGTRTAQALKVGDSVDGFFAPKGDEDFFEFNVYQKALLVFELTGVVNVKPRLVLLDQEGRELKSAAAAKPGESLQAELELEPGTYLARLAPEEKNQANVRDKYTFRIRAR